MRTDTLPHAHWGGTGQRDPLPAALCVGGGGAAPTPRPQPYLLGQAVSQASTVPLVLGGPLVDVPSEAAGTQVCDAVCQGLSLTDAEGA